VAVRRQTRRSGLLIREVNDAPAREHFLARYLEEAGFVVSPPGLQMRRVAEPVLVAPSEPEDEEPDA